MRTLISIGNAAETREKEYVLVDGVRVRCPVGQSRAIEPAISGNPRVIPKSWCAVAAGAAAAAVAATQEAMAISTGQRGGGIG